MKTAFKYAVMQGIINKNPTDFVEAPKNIKRQINFYNIDELKKLKEAIKGHKIETAVKIAIYTGLRREEICGLTWSNIDFENRVLSVSDARTMAGSKEITKGTKTDASQRLQYICDELFDTLTAEKKGKKITKLFLGMHILIQTI